MQIVIISDSHGNRLGIEKIFQTMKFDYLFFLGDGLGDLDKYIYLDNVYAVSGNCDFFSSVANERIFDIDGYKFFITHGNKYGVKSSLNFIREKALDEKVNFAIFGHTHSSVVEEYHGIYIINPGSFHKKSNGQSYGMILNIENKKVDISMFSV